MVTEWCRAAVDATDALVTGSQALSARAAEHLRIGASQTIAAYLAPSWLGEFRRRRGEPPVQLRVANSQDVIAALRAREDGSGTRDPRPATGDPRLSALLQRRPNGAAKAAVAWADDST